MPPTKDYLTYLKSVCFVRHHADQHRAKLSVKTPEWCNKTVWFPQHKTAGLDLQEELNGNFLSKLLGIPPPPTQLGAA